MQFFEIAMVEFLERADVLHNAFGGSSGLGLFFSQTAAQLRPDGAC